MALRGNFLLLFSAAAVTYALGTAGRAWAAMRLANYWNCNWDKFSDVLMPLIVNVALL